MQLLTTVVGQGQTELINELVQAVRDCKCNILESRMTVFADVLVSYMHVEGNWNHIAKLESTLEWLCQRRELKLTTWRTEADKANETQLIPYAVDIVAADRSGTVHELTKFFLQRNIVICDLSSSAYPSGHTSTPMLSAHFILGVPANMRIISLREEFLDFCDRLNLDAMLEPIKR